jgi:hypothetical protein
MGRKMRMYYLELLVGNSGYTVDEMFKTVVEAVETFGTFLEDEEEEGQYAQIITTKYQDKMTGRVYELWYQVRTPESPEGMVFAYGFGRA